MSRWCWYLYTAQIFTCPQHQPCVVLDVSVYLPYIIRFFCCSISSDGCSFQKPVDMAYEIGPLSHFSFVSTPARICDVSTHTTHVFIIFIMRDTNHLFHLNYQDLDLLVNWLSWVLDYCRLQRLCICKSNQHLLCIVLLRIRNAHVRIEDFKQQRSHIVSGRCSRQKGIGLMQQASICRRAWCCSSSFPAPWWEHRLHRWAEKCKGRRCSRTGSCDFSRVRASFLQCQLENPSQFLTRRGQRLRRLVSCHGQLALIEGPTSKPVTQTFHSNPCRAWRGCSLSPKRLDPVDLQVWERGFRQSPTPVESKGVQR